MKSIHEEKELRQVSDWDLLKKLLLFARPHWKVIAASLIVAGIIVLTTLLQPIIVKIAIDDRLNGVYKPMYVQTMEPGASEAERTEALEGANQMLDRQGLKVDAVFEMETAYYFRLKSDPQRADESLPLGKAQILSLEGEKVLIHDWVQTSDESVMLQFEHDNTAQLPRAGASPDSSVKLIVGDRTLEAAILTDEQLLSFREGDFVQLLWLGAFFLVIVVGGAFLNFAQMNMLQNTGQKIIFDIRQKMFEHLAKLHSAFFDRNPVGRLVTRVAHDVEALNNLYSQVIVNLIKEVCMLIGIIGFMLFLSVELTMISFIVIPILALVTFYYRNLMRNTQRLVRTLLSRLNSFLAENLSGMRVIQIFIREKRQYKQFKQMNEAYYKAGMRGATLNSVFQPTIMFIGNIALAVIVWYGGNKVLVNVLTFGTVYAFIQYIQQFYRPLMGLADRYGQIQTAMASAERIFELLEEEPAITDHIEAQRLPQRIAGAIEFKNVWFAYNQEEWVLKDVNFRVEPGETVAFVGATGAGKSSIISLINRFYDIQQGELTIDGADVRRLRIADLRKHVAIIQQDPFIFTGDVRYNIRLNTDLSDEQLIAAAKQLNMHDFIMKLPQQYDTLLGEQGVTLSSGQKQLLSFLRAAVYNPDILILDEATANIDTETEQVVQEALHRISENRTTLIVAHRLSTIQHADKIIVLKKGEIQEMGSHAELLRRKGYYYRLYEVQHEGAAETKLSV